MNRTTKQGGACAGSGRAACVAMMGVLLGACTPEVGSERWCEQLSEKPRGEWTVDEVRDYVAHCVFSVD